MKLEPKTAKIQTYRNIAGARKSKLPAFVRPQLATLVDSVPQGDEWLHEIKFDGYRILCRIDNKRAKFLTREGQDWTGRFSGLVETAQGLPVHQVFLDGEVVALEESGKTNFQLLQNSLRQNNAATLVYFVFDLLYLDGWDLTRSSLRDRKKILETFLKPRGKLRTVSATASIGSAKVTNSIKKAVARVSRELSRKRRTSLIVRGEAGTGSRSNAPRARSSSSAGSRNLPDHGPAWEHSWWVCMMNRVICGTGAGSEPDSPNKASGTALAAQLARAQIATVHQSPQGRREQRCSLGRAETCRRGCIR